MEASFIKNVMHLNGDALNDMYIDNWGNNDVYDLTKSHTGIIRDTDEYGMVGENVLVFFQFRHNIPAKQAAKLLIERLEQFMKECDEHGIV